MDQRDKQYIKAELLKQWAPFCRRVGSANVDYVIERVSNGEPVVVDRAPGGFDRNFAETLILLADIVQFLTVGYNLIIVAIRTRQAMTSEDEFIKQVSAALSGVTLSAETLDKMRAFYRSTIKVMMGADKRDT